MFEKQSIILFTNTKGVPAYELAHYLSERFGKKLIELGTGNTEYDKESLNPTLDFVDKLFREFDPVMIVFNYNTINLAGKKKIKVLLKAFRDLRIPYIGVNSQGVSSSLKKIMVPVGFLPEEKEKAPWSNSFIKFCKSQITLLKPKDRGTRARKNVEFIQKVLKSYKRGYELIHGSRNSFKIEHEAIRKYQNDYDMFFMTGSRAYGLDDIFFGPKEYHILRKSKKPVLIINPRDDIYVLCGN